MIDNINKIRPLLVFESEDDFYYLQILQRKKDNPHIGSNSRVIKNYYITSVEYLDRVYDEVKELCTLFNARASIRLNKRSFEKVAYKSLINTAANMSNRDYKNVGRSYSRAVGQNHNDPNNTWILDLDGEEENTFDFIYSIVGSLDSANPVGEKSIDRISSKSGSHLIVLPFDPREFKKEYPGIAIHKDNPTNLYIP